MTKITKELVELIGFRQIKNTSNPVYYCGWFKDTGVIVGNREPGDHEGEWSLRNDRGDCASFSKELSTVKDLIDSISQRAYERGKRDQKQEIKKAIGLIN